MFIGLLSVCIQVSFNGSLPLKETIKCLILNNRPCQTSPTLVNINFNENPFHPFSVNVNKCGRSCNTSNDSYARVCVPNKVKNMNVKVFNLMLVVNETRFLVQNKLCECKCGLNESVCNSKQKWNHNECWCECKKLDD